MQALSSTQRALLYTTSKHAFNGNSHSNKWRQMGGWKEAVNYFQINHNMLKDFIMVCLRPVSCVCISMRLLFVRGPAYNGSITVGSQLVFEKLVKFYLMNCSKIWLLLYLFLYIYMIHFQEKTKAHSSLISIIYILCHHRL